MAFLTPAATLTARMATQWAASSYSAVPVEYDNIEQDPPEFDPTDAAATALVRQSILSDDTSGLTFSQDQTFGVVIYEVMTPLNAALGYALAIAETIRGFFNRFESGGLVCVGLDGSGPSWQQIGRDDEMGAHRVNVTVPWQYFEDVVAGDPAMTANQVFITQAAHGFANEWVGKSGGSYVEAGSDEAVGFATSVTANAFLLTVGGPITWTAHGLSDGPVYLHVSTDGGSQSAAPSAGERFQRVAWAVATNTIIVQVEPKLA